VASEFDRIHSVHRALEVGALHRILPPADLRPYLIHAVESGIAREKEPLSNKSHDENSATMPKTIDAATPTRAS
jgi:hypothetical protein